MSAMRAFVTINSDNSDGRVVPENSPTKMLYVAEVIADAGLEARDDEHLPCGPDTKDKIYEAVVDLRVPLFCCRSPRRTAPPISPEQALRSAAMKGREGLMPGQLVSLNGREIAL